MSIRNIPWVLVLRFSNLLYYPLVQNRCEYQFILCYNTYKHFLSLIWISSSPFFSSNWFSSIWYRIHSGKEGSRGSVIKFFTILDTVDTASSRVSARLRVEIEKTFNFFEIGGYSVSIPSSMVEDAQFCTNHLIFNVGKAADGPNNCNCSKLHHSRRWRLSPAANWIYWTLRSTLSHSACLLQSFDEATSAHRHDTLSPHPLATVRIRSPSLLGPQAAIPRLVVAARWAIGGPAGANAVVHPPVPWCTPMRPETLLQRCTLAVRGRSFLILITPARPMFNT